MIETLALDHPRIGWLLLLRHGETVGRSSIRFHGATDVALAEEGRDQVRAAVRGLELGALAHVLSSPLRRAVESVRAIVPEREPICIEGLRELDFGHCEGLTSEEIAQRFPAFHAVWRAGRAEGFPGGEPFVRFVARVQAAGDDLAERGWLAGPSLLVAHKGVLKVLLAHWLGLPSAERHRFDPPLGGGFLLRGRVG